jgi:hypothetical protein
MSDRLEEAVSIVYEALAEYLGEDEVEYFSDTSLRVSLTVGSFVVDVEEE